MSYAITMATFNRAEMLRRTLDAIITTTRREAETEGVVIYVADNASADGSADLLRQYEAEGKLRAWILKENLGTDIGRNAFWEHTAGKDTIRIDDKVLPLCDGWLYSMKRIAYENHALVAAPYDPTVLGLLNVAPPVAYLHWDVDMGMGGPLIFIPAEARDQLGACDELFPGHLYGWSDCTYIERARLLGWHFGFSLRTPVEFLARADPTRRNAAMDYHHLYLERLREYREAERDVFIDVKSTLGYQFGLKAGLEAKCSS